MNVLRRFPRRLLLALLTVALSTTVASAAATTSGSGITCRNLAFPVVTPALATLRGTLCAPIRYPRATVILVHGSTYARSYWDPPGLDPARYSTLRQLAGRGYQTLAVDRLGSGRSDRPPDAQVTATANADALHGVIRRFRLDPQLRTWTRAIIVVGHSSGSSLAILEAATYDDVDALVVTGFRHFPADEDPPLFPAMLYPASQDPKFAGDSSIPAGYVTTEPGMRVDWYYGWNSDEAAYQADEAVLKDAMPSTDSGNFVGEAFVAARSPEVDVPALVVVGGRDIGACRPGCPNLAAVEQGFWPKSPAFQAVVIPRTAHALALHRNAAATTKLIGDWLDRTIP